MIKIFKKMFSKDEEVTVTLTFKVPSFTPKEDITAFEVAQHILFNKALIFTGDAEKMETDIKRWWRDIPSNMARHYTEKEISITVSSKSLLIK